MELASQREIIGSAMANGASAGAKARRLVSSRDAEIAELATAVNFLAVAVEQLGSALTDERRARDLNV